MDQEDRVFLQMEASVEFLLELCICSCLCDLSHG